LRPTGAVTILPPMSLNKPLRALGWLLLLAMAPAGFADPEPVAPKVSPLDQSFLTRVVRRTLEAELGDGEMYEPGYVPPSLGTLECYGVVTLRQHGHVRGAGTSQRRPVVAACRDAAIAALAAAAQTGPVSLEWLTRVVVEIELAGDEVPVPFDGAWDDAEAFNRLIEPGVDGVALEYDRARVRFCPSEIITKNNDVHEALLQLARRLAVSPSQLPGTSIHRFRTQHWLETEPGGRGGEVLELHRGLVVLGPDVVTDANLAATIQAVSEYMVYRQLPNGLFSYQYDPSNDRYTDDDNLVRQAGAAWALALHARWSGKSASAAAAKRTLDYLTRRLVDLPTPPRAAFIAGARGQHKLGITALAALAMYDHPDGEIFADVRSRLTNGVYWLQTESGMFVTAFPPSKRFSGQYYFPGEALLLIARDYEHQPSQRAVDAFDRGYDYYGRLFEEDPTPPFAAWHIQAFSRMAEPTRRRDYAEFVFKMTDWLLARQHDETTTPWPELVGGVEAYVQARVGVATASYLEAFTDALETARRLGDHQRAARYERAVRLAARFVMQLQVRPEEAYYIHSRRDAVGGIRTSPSDNRLRIDHCQHALVALMKTRRVLYGHNR